MMIKNKIFNYVFLLVGLTFPFFLFACRCPAESDLQIPQSVIENSNQQIISKTGDDFFKNNFTLNFDESKEIDGNFLMKYNFTISDKPFVDEEISFLVDSTGKVLSDQKIIGIPNCKNGDCDFNIDEDKAIQIAESNGLEKGIKNWKTDFVWDDKYEKYVWKIISTASQSQGSEGYRGSGSEILIDANNGKVLDSNMWHVR